MKNNFFLKYYQHVFCEPSFSLGNAGADAQSQTLLAQQRITAVAAAERNDFVRLRTLDDDGAFGIARPVVVQRLLQRQRAADRVETAHKVVIAQRVQHGRPHSGHDPHRGGHVRRIGQFNADFRQRRTNRAHTERNHIHRSS